MFRKINHILRPIPYLHFAALVRGYRNEVLLGVVFGGGVHKVPVESRLDHSPQELDLLEVTHPEDRLEDGASLKMKRMPSGSSSA